MKSKVILMASLLAAIAITPLSSHAQSADKLNIGDDLPSMATPLKNANPSTHYGTSTTYASLVKDNGLLVMFSCNTCPFVIKNQSVTNKVIEYANSHNVGVVVINSNEAQRDGADSYDAMNKYVQAQGFRAPYLVDENSKLADLFGASHTPEVFLFNRQGKLVYKGAMNDNPGSPKEAKQFYVKDAMDEMIAGKKIDPNATKSIGCGIKRKA
jgi:thioredoxin-related protein